MRFCVLFSCQFELHRFHRTAHQPMKGHLDQDEMSRAIMFSEILLFHRRCEGVCVCVCAAEGLRVISTRNYYCCLYFYHHFVSVALLQRKYFLNKTVNGQKSKKKNRTFSFSEKVWNSWERWSSFFFPIKLHECLKFWLFDRVSSWRCWECFSRKLSGCLSALKDWRVWTDFCRVIGAALVVWSHIGREVFGEEYWDWMTSYQRLVKETRVFFYICSSSAWRTSRPPASSFHIIEPKEEQIANSLENNSFFLITFCFSSTGDKKNK